MKLKEAASLTGALLVRKGAAVPIQLVSQAMADEQGRALPRQVLSQTLTDEQGHSLPPQLVSRALRPLALVRSSMQRPAQTLTVVPGQPPDANLTVVTGGGGGIGGGNDRAKLSLRVDRRRHLRVKVAAAHLRVRIQDILTAALDSYLSRVTPDLSGGKCECLTPADSARTDSSAPSSKPSADAGPKAG